MSKYFMLLVCMNILYVLSFGQASYVLSGQVVDEKNMTLTGASVMLYPEAAGTVTDEEGNFVIRNLTEGSYTIEVSFIGYLTLFDTLMIEGNMTYTARLKQKTVSLNEVVVAGNYVDYRKKEESLNIEIVNDVYLRQNMGGSLMTSLERLPGVSALSIGSDQSKPVIRGLGFNRVVVIENSIKHEAQQWGLDHGLEIDQYAVDHVEVIKGPASLMYGSDAIGGVIDMKNRNLPAKNTFGGTVDLTAKTNNGLLGGSVLLFARKNWFYANARATILNYGDYKVPADSIDIYSYRAPLNNNYLRNTAGKDRNLHLDFGILQNRFQSKFYLSYINKKNGFFANAHGLEPRNVDAELHDKSNRDINYPYHTVNHFKVISTSQYNWDLTKLEIDLGYQRNFRQEWSQYVSHGYMPPVFPDTLYFDPDLERQFEKHVYSANLRLLYQLTEKTELRAGLSSEYQDNRIDGRGFIIPAFDQVNLGGFAFARYNLSAKSVVSAGIRYDYGNIRTSEYYDWFPSPVIENGDTTMENLQRAEYINRRFSNVSWSAGYTYNSGRWMIKSNIGKSFRMPIAKELAANGVNYHRFSYEIGDPDLSPEISYQLDLGIEYTSMKFAIGTTPFVNYFTNYIYLNPTSEFDRLYGNGNQIHEYTQSKVFRYGAEIHAHYEVFEFLQLGIIGEYVYSEQLSGVKKGFTLPFSPPASAILNLKLQKQRLNFIEDAYFSFDYRLTAAQNNIVPPEETTPGYQVINLGLGGGIQIKDQRIFVSMQVQNLLNTKYFNHTSYYRLINVPEPGRNFIVNVSVPFSVKMNK